MARQKKLVIVNVGRTGLCDNFHIMLADVLAKRQTVKVKVAGSCDSGPDDLVPTIEEVNDCVCVNTIGNTITLHRQKGLPRPEGVPYAKGLEPSASELPESVEDKIERKALAKETHRQIQLDGVPTTPAFGIVSFVEDSQAEEQAEESVPSAESLPAETEIVAAVGGEER